MSKKLTIDEFIEKSRNKHGNKYDYSEIIYHDNKTPIHIICPKHGVFLQRPDKHMQGQGCPLCSKTKKNTLESFIKQAKQIHNNYYDYSKTQYINNRTKLLIVCPEHGEFWQTPKNHIKGQGCPICSKSKTKTKKYTTETFINAAKQIHGDRYDYSETDYVDMTTKVKIICPEHGVFYQTPYLHLKGSGCKQCACDTLGLSKRKNTEQFIEEAKKIHGDKYDYSKTNYLTAKNKVCIICPSHGEFYQSPWKHITGCGCPKCVHHISKGESEIYDFVVSLVGGENVIQSERKLIYPKEIDIYIPSLKIGIEYNGLYWHGSTNIDKNSHLEKLEAANAAGIKLIQIFEDEYVNNQEIVFNKIKHIIGHETNIKKIPGRKCEIRVIEPIIAKDFLIKNHIQGYVTSTIHIGAFFENNIVGIMSFKRETLDSNNWELTRFATDNAYLCQGVGGKLFSYFTKNYSPLYIKSFADRRWTINDQNNLYTKLGFVIDGYTKPDYKYFNPTDGIKRQHKFGFRKQKLSKLYNLPLTMTETEMTEKLGYTKIYDCGLIRYVWKKQY